MKRYIIINLLIVLGIFVSIILINYNVDPFHLFDDNLNKKNFAINTDRRIAKLIDYNKKQKNVIILGGSRSDALNEKYFQKYNINVYNLAYGGGSIFEVIDTLEYLFNNKLLTGVNRVIVGFTLDIFNESYLRNEVVKVIPLIKNKFQYLTSFYILKKSVFKLFEYDKPIIKVIYDNEKINQTIDYAAKRRYSSYIYPESSINKLREIVENLNKIKIKIDFFIPPNYIDFDKKIEEYRLQKEYQNMLFELKKLGKVYNFNTNYMIKNDIINYSDGIHFKENITELIVKDLALEVYEDCNIQEER